MGRCPYLESIQQETKLLLAFFLADTNVFEHHLLDIMLVYTQTSTCIDQVPLKSSLRCKPCLSLPSLSVPKSKMHRKGLVIAFLCKMMHLRGWNLLPSQRSQGIMLLELVGLQQKDIAATEEHE